MRCLHCHRPLTSDNWLWVYRVTEPGKMEGQIVEKGAFEDIHRIAVGPYMICKRHNKGVLLKSDGEVHTPS